MATEPSAAALTASERMVVRAAAELHDGDVVFVGIGLPDLACNLARATHAPKLFITSPGHRAHDGRSRRDLGLPGGGPTRIITDLGVLEFDESGEAVLTELYEGVTVEQVRAACGWPLRVAEQLEITPNPTQEALGLLREKLDPGRFYL